MECSGYLVSRRNHVENALTIADKIYDGRKRRRITVAGYQVEQDVRSD